MLHDFIGLNFNHFDKIYEILRHSPSQDSAYTIVNTLGWQRNLCPKILIENDFAVLALDIGGKFYVNSPLAKDADSFEKAVTWLESNGIKSFYMVSDDWQREIFSRLGFKLSLQRNMSEYLYNTEDLSLLKGKAYHSKRNFINSFTYQYELREYQQSDFDEVMSLMDNWNITSSSKTVNVESNWSYLEDGLKITDQNANNKLSDFDLEKNVLSEVLLNYKSFRVIADVLTIDGKIQGFMCGERLLNNVGAIYFQKANTDYKGIYQFLDNLFIKTRLNDTLYINKQEDMGIAGLRKSKLSYKPIRLIDRYNAVKDVPNA